MQGMELIAKVLDMFGRAAIRHSKQPPRLLYTTARMHAYGADAYLTCLRELQRINGGSPVLSSVVNETISSHSGGQVEDNVFADAIERTAYPIPEGKTYVVKYLHDGMFAIVKEYSESLSDAV